MMKKLTLGEFSVHPKYDVPSIEVLVDGEVAGHLTPFRGYYFQVSQTYDGQTDLGHSINSGCKLENYIKFLFDKSQQQDVFTSLAFTALNEFVRVYKVYSARANGNEGDDLVVDINLNPLWTQQDNFRDFITASVEWVEKISRGF